MADAVVIDGKALALQVRAEIAQKVAKYELKPNLAVILVGNDEASLIYDRNKQRAVQARVPTVKRRETDNARCYVGYDHTEAWDKAGRGEWDWVKPLCYQVWDYQAV